MTAIILEGQSQCERRPLVLGAREFKIAPQQGGQASADIEPEASAPKTTANRSICLAKGLKDMFLLLDWNTDAAVADGDMQRLTSITGIEQGFDGYCDAALFSKLDRVAEQIFQDLPDFVRVGSDCRRTIRSIFQL